MGTVMEQVFLAAGRGWNIHSDYFWSFRNFWWQRSQPSVHLLLWGSWGCSSERKWGERYGSSLAWLWDKAELHVCDTQIRPAFHASQLHLITLEQWSRKGWDGPSQPGFTAVVGGDEFELARGLSCDTEPGHKVPGCGSLLLPCAISLLFISGPAHFRMSFPQSALSRGMHGGETGSSAEEAGRSSGVFFWEFPSTGICISCPSWCCSGGIWETGLCASLGRSKRITACVWTLVSALTDSYLSGVVGMRP